MRTKIEVSSLREGFLVESDGKGDVTRVFCADRDALREELIARVDQSVATEKAWFGRTMARDTQIINQ